MAGEEDVTLGEMSRRFDRFEKAMLDSMRELHTNFVTSVVWQAEKRIIEDQRTSLGREIADLKSTARTAHAEKVLEHKELHARIDTLRAENEKKERERIAAEAAAEDAIRKEKAKQVFTLVAAGFSAILSIGAAVVVAIIVNGIGV